ncbi:uncharacterized protein BT62DRAFT_76506 [Guyanagaster necrorhizus]|uniref:Uncharacterized protein n=1 Tax=Guyanagaster necrorhizus TaxID=856835 RepID=A0A9P7VVI9_9AGAR|nr:uncharacterized protein BT62DRAFT_76506 [Guyanagaster necrorhizus MCA 3950]KAG7447342.1 hypothetical protein BT62DRAFT_76506 [Guyanagaster necrorhizus MCA 3950]
MDTVKFNLQLSGRCQVCLDTVLYYLLYIFLINGFRTCQCNFRYKNVIVIRRCTHAMSKASLKGFPQYEHMNHSCMDSSSISRSWTWSKSPHKPSRINHELIPSPPTSMSFFSRNWSIISLSLLTTGTFVWTVFFAHASTDPSQSVTHFHGGREIPGEPDPPLIRLKSPSMMTLLLQISTSATTLLLGELAVACYERVRWQKASSPIWCVGRYVARTIESDEHLSCPRKQRSLGLRDRGA